MTIQELITRVAQGSGSDRQLDREIIQTLHPDIGDCYPGFPGDEPIFWHDPFHKMPAPCLTSSLDAIRALFKARLEGCNYTSNEIPEGQVMIWDKNDKRVANKSHPDIHRAFLSATLKAIAAKEG